MTATALALGVFALVVVLFATELLPLPVTALFGAVLMVLFGIIDAKQAFAGFGSSTLMMVVGMLIIGRAMYESGLVSYVGDTLARSRRLTVSAIMVIVPAVAGILSAFMSNTAIAAAFLPMADSLIASKGEKRLKAGLYVAIGVASVLGGNLTLVGSTPQLVAQGILESSDAQTMGFFTLAQGALPLFVVGLGYCAFSARFLAKGDAGPEPNAQCADGGNSPQQEAGGAIPPHAASRKNMAITAAVFAACALCFAFGAADEGLIALAGALALVVARCISLPSIVRNVDWSSVVVLGGSLGFSSGLEASGAGEWAARAIIDMCGGSQAEPIVIFAVMVIMTAVLSNFMSNTAVVAMFVPLGLFLSDALCCNPLAMTVGIVLASSICFGTPIGSPPMTLTLSSGLSFKDYVKTGMPLCAMCAAIVIACVPALYGL